jgi:p-cumate 2,3-dioxygenase subunit beta
MSAIALPSRQEVEDLLYREAALLDEWRLEEWLEMLTDDAIYQVPSTEGVSLLRWIRVASKPRI